MKAIRKANAQETLLLVKAKSREREKERGSELQGSGNLLIYATSAQLTN